MTTTMFGAVDKVQNADIKPTLVPSGELSGVKDGI